MGWTRRKYILSALALVLVLIPAGLLAWSYFAGTVGAEAIEKDREAIAFRPEPVLWQAFLDLVLDDQGGVRYEKARTGEARALLDRYLDQVARATPATFLDDHDRLAFYINAYNALTIEGVLRYWPIQSVEEVGSFHYFFRQRAYKVAGQIVSLHGFETRVIRKYDPRLHFALNCASASCPSLNARAWFAEGLDAQLEKAAQNFIVQSTAYDPIQHTYSLSPILLWYQDDFGGEQGVKTLLQRHLGPLEPEARFEYQDYDWRLNWSLEENPAR